MFLKKTELNTLLNKVGGTVFNNSVYFCSTEYYDIWAWGVNFSNGGVYDGVPKEEVHYVRLVRAI